MLPRDIQPSDLFARQRGFALVVVIWGLGLIGLLALAFITAARWRAQAAVNIAAAARAEALADGAIELAMASVAAQAAGREGPSAFDGHPVFCALPGAAIAAVAIEDEGGKVDINAASPKLLASLLAGLGVEPFRTDKLSQNIVAFRSATAGSARVEDAAYAAAKLPFGPKRALFQTTLELDQVLGMDAILFHRMLPLVTTYSARPGVNATTAPPALFAALAGFDLRAVNALLGTPWPNGIDRADPRFPLAFSTLGASGVLNIHAEVLLPGGQTSGRERLVDIRAGAAEKFTVKEIRRGGPRFLDNLEALQKQGAPPPC